MRLRRFLPVPASLTAQYTLIAPLQNSNARNSTAAADSKSGRRRWWLYLGIVLLVVVFIQIAGFVNVKVAVVKFVFHTLGGSPMPPTFEEFYAAERAYPQHNASLPYPEGVDGRYVWFSNQHYGFGWNNIFEALYMMAHMAYLSNRAFVFEPYTWHNGPEPYVVYNRKLIPSRIPLSAIVDGPIAGGSFPPTSPSPRAVSAEWFKEICPEERRTRISIREMNEGLRDATAEEIMNKYVDMLSARTEGCIEMFGEKDEHPFDYMHFGNAHLLTIYPSLSKSPVMTAFKWSPLVLSAVHNKTGGALVSPEFMSSPLPNVVDDLMAVHVRRGDYDGHCKYLEKWSVPYMGWNQMPGLADPFVPPTHSKPGANLDIYLKHCWPDVEMIAERVEEIRREWELERGAGRLKKLYVLTNGEKAWLETLKSKLKESGSWDLVLTSRDISLTFEQKYVGQAIDMAIAERAAVFIGNGFSSMSANIILMRSIHKLPLISNHFW